MYFYRVDGALAASALSGLSFPSAPPGEPELFLVRRGDGPALFRATQSRHLGASSGVDWLLADDPLPRPLPVCDLANPRWRQALLWSKPRSGKKRVHLLAVGDVGGTLLTALKLLGGPYLSAIGIRDVNDATVERYVCEMGQMVWPWEEDTLPAVEAVPEDQLFQCDVFIFAAAKAVPAVGSGVADVRMAQLAANRPLAEHFARLARAAGFSGLFMVLSDPVDPLCRAAWLASNTAPDGTFDGRGLLPEQVRGFGLGVMNARACDLARRDARFAAYPAEGRMFGPHGRGLVAANSIAQYDDALSRDLTQQVETANLHIRELGFKPYLAPAVSSGAMQLLLALQGRWHCSSVPLGKVWFGVKNRFTPQGTEVETLPLPPALLDRLRETETTLNAMI